MGSTKGKGKKERGNGVIIAYFSTGYPLEIPSPTRHASMAAAVTAFREFASQTQRDYYDEKGTANASLYQFSNDEADAHWQEAERFAGIGIPFDYPSYVLGIGKRGGIVTTRC